MDVLRAVVQGLAFIVELAALAALAVWGWRTGGSAPVKVVLAVLAPAALAGVWGAFLAPRSRRRLTGSPLVLAKLVALCGSGGLLAAAGHPVAGFALMIVAAVDVLAAAALGVS
ncbi:MAG TPA: YrdB family protein [Motilibacteraceae bacterium]|nr:YrdB family protein [Motilibacteraceae bacterium]